jgi:hypothetical protein
LSISALLQIKMNSNFNCSYMAIFRAKARRTLKQNRRTSWRNFVSKLNCHTPMNKVGIWYKGILWDKNHINIFCSEIWAELIFGWPTFKICATPPFSITKEISIFFFFFNISILHLWTIYLWVPGNHKGLQIFTMNNIIK